MEGNKRGNGTFFLKTLANTRYCGLKIKQIIPQGVSIPSISAFTTLHS